MACCARRPSRPPAAAAGADRGQEVWAAGVTYYRSRTARMEEVKAVTGGAGDFTTGSTGRTPRTLFKADPHRVVGPGQQVRIRRDSHWNIPEPELTLVVNARGRSSATRSATT